MACLPFVKIDYRFKIIYKYGLPSLSVYLTSNIPPYFLKTLKIAKEAPIWACNHFLEPASKYIKPLNPPTIRSNQAT